MKGQLIGYVRVSSFDRNPERQLEGVQFDRVFTDKASDWYENARGLHKQHNSKNGGVFPCDPVGNIRCIVRHLIDLTSYPQKLSQLVLMEGGCFFMLFVRYDWAIFPASQGNPPNKKHEIEVEFSQLLNEGVLHEEITVFRQRHHGNIETGGSG